MKASILTGIASVGTLLLIAVAFSAPAGAQAATLEVIGTSVGVQTSSPVTTLHVVESDPNKANRALGRLSGTTFAPQFEYENQGSGVTWRLGANNADEFVINDTADLGIAEMKITRDGRVFLNNSQVHPDYVFEPDYDLMSLEELELYIEENGHLPGVLTSQQRERDGGIDISTFPLQLLEKIEELALYTLQQEDVILELREANAKLMDRVAALEKHTQSSGK